MFHKRFLNVFSAVAFISLLLAGQALAAAGDTPRLSLSSNGAQGNADSIHPSISPDGRYVTFNSAANDLVPGDTNGAIDMFLRDRQTNTTTRVSVASDGTQGNQESAGKAAITPDGRYVAFESLASNLVAGDTNNWEDIFRRDTLTHTTIRVSLASDGSEGNRVSASVPAISDDGRYVLFQSLATNLVPGDTNGASDVFLRDTLTNTTTRIPVASDGTQGNADAITAPDMSADGRYVVFSSLASNLVPGDTNGRNDVFLRDTHTHTTTRISIASDGTQGNRASGNSPVISADGRYVAFDSFASNLVPGDTNGTIDTFIRDTWSGTTSRISVASAGTQANGLSNNPNISPDGRFVVFESAASNLVAGDTNGATDVFQHDVQTNSTVLVSIASNGAQGDQESHFPVVSAGGSLIAFESRADNLVAGDSNRASDVFVHEVVPQTSRPAALPATGFAAGRVSHLPAQPATKAYADSGMMLEIPSLNLKSAIVGVPQSPDAGWDLSWLGGSVGYLAGSAFPTWAGNSVLAAHVYEANGLPGPFINLGRLRWGQPVIIHAWGQQYIYEVRSVKAAVDPTDTTALTEHEDYPWLTLITCHDYDAQTNSYRWRTVVRAVLVKIQDAP